jgi:hypothetical protein
MPGLAPGSGAFFQSLQTWRVRRSTFASEELPQPTLTARRSDQAHHTMYTSLRAQFLHL